MTDDKRRLFSYISGSQKSDIRVWAGPGSLSNRQVISPGFLLASRGSPGSSGRHTTPVPQLHVDFSLRLHTVLPLGRPFSAVKVSLFIMAPVTSDGGPLSCTELVPLWLNRQKILFPNKVTSTVMGIGTSTCLL